MKRRILVSALAVAASAIGPVLTAAPALADPLATAPCTPAALPLLANSDGSGDVMWITNSGLVVGESEVGVDAHGRPTTDAVYWTRDDAGYHVHALPNDPLVNDEVLDVNESNRMVVYGWSVADAQLETYVYDLPSDHWWHLPNVGPLTRGRRINAAGVVSGGGNLSDSSGTAATWAPPYTKLNTLAHYGWASYASGINDAGQTVGFSNKHQYTPSIDATVRHSGPHAYGPLLVALQWPAGNGAPTVLPSLYANAELFAINDAGTVVGSSDTPQSRVDAAYWVNGTVHDMGGRDGALTEARGLSQGGWVTGGSAFPGAGGQAFVWTGAGTLQLLPALDGPAGDSNAHGVNDQMRQIGGWSENGAGAAPATIWQCPSGFSTAG